MPFDLFNISFTNMPSHETFNCCYSCMISSTAIGPLFNFDVHSNIQCMTVGPCPPPRGTLKGGNTILIARTKYLTQVKTSQPGVNIMD